MLVSVDAKALEWRIIVWLSNDPVGIRELNSGEDVHEINKQAFTLPTRLVSKVFLFRCIFRGSGYAYSVDPDFMHVSTDPEYWDHVTNLFYNKYKGIDKCHKMWENLVVLGKPIVSPLGREWLIPLRNGIPHLPTLTNWPVQGSGNDLMSIARVSLKKRLHASAKLVNTIHDSIVVDTPENLVGSVTSTMIEVFNDIPANIKKLFGVTVPISFPGEVKVGHNMKEMKEIK